VAPLHDWIVLTKGKLDLIEEIISLGHKYSGLLSRYKVAKEPTKSHCCVTSVSFCT